MQKENKNLELLLQGTLRENEKCMSDLERYAFLFPPPTHTLFFCGWKDRTAAESYFFFIKKYRAKIREKTLERELARIAGENWQVSLSTPPTGSSHSESI